MGVGNHSPWSYAGADKECLHGRYGVGVGNHSPYIFYGRRSEGPRTMVVVLCRRSASYCAAGCFVAICFVEIGELAEDHAVAGGAQRGRWSESA